MMYIPWALLITHNILKTNRSHLMKTGTIIISLLCFALTLGACKNNDKPKENSTPEKVNAINKKVLEPEMLINKNEAAELLGEAVKDGEKRETKVVGLKLCMYNPVNSSSSRYLQVGLTQDSFMPPEGVGSETIYRQLKKMLASSKIDVKELGNEAFIATGGLYILKDGYYILISSGNIARDETILTLKSAGKKVLENLDKVK
ncbi:MAG: hypothetical protein HKK67_07495 [Chlorobiaceae bacterium]|nr:hypothetical protein [Chlorobiaceae bacterium]